MAYRPEDEMILSSEFLDSLEADKFAQQMDDVLLDLDDMDLEACPPDYRFVRGDKEAWVYEHGNIAELVFVKTQSA